MERFGRTGNLLLGYGVSQRTFGNDPSSSRQSMPEKSSDDSVDFNDVFGGPPKRFSMHDTRYSFGAARIEVEESRSLWPGAGEKPVFGESTRRHTTSEDFYDDIFKGSEGSHGSPGSRVLSPAHPKFEPFGTSLPAQFSLPAKLTKAIDLPTFGSSSSSRSPHRYKEDTSNVHTPSISLSRFSSPAMHEHDDFTNTPEQSPGQTLLSPESSPTGSTENDKGGNSKQNTASEFHFSIHKWAGRGVPLLISLRAGKNPTLKDCSKVSPVSIANVQDAGFLNEDSSADRGVMMANSEIGLSEGMKKELSMEKIEVNEHEVKPVRDEVEAQGGEEIGRKAEGKENTEKTTGLSKSKFGATAKSEHGGKMMNSNKKAEVKKPAVLSPKKVKGKVRDFVKIFNQESSPMSKMNAVARSLSSRWNSNKIDDEISDLISELDIKLLSADVKMMPDASSTTGLGSEVPVDNKKMMSEASSSTGLGSEVAVDNVKMMPNTSSATQSGVKGYVDNVKTMSDASRTKELGHNVRAKNVKTMSDASGTKELGSKVAADNANTKLDAPSTTQLDSKARADEVKIVPDASFVVGERIDKKQVGQNRTIRKLSDIRCPQMDASPSTGPVPYSSKVTAENVDEPSLENFHVEELSPVEDKLLKIEEDSESIRASDSKIRLWSNGRKGNIRSLLSTLQLVLWPESGWKPVALVDIIEANAVKKAYNKAMLCLHPDKLQQKGAAAHQKYLAEKVFDMLQEAWDHFNSLGTPI